LIGAAPGGRQIYPGGEGLFQILCEYV